MLDLGRWARCRTEGASAKAADINSAWRRRWLSRRVLRRETLKALNHLGCSILRATLHADRDGQFVLPIEFSPAGGGELPCVPKCEHMREALASYIEATYHLRIPRSWHCVELAHGRRYAANAYIERHPDLRGQASVSGTNVTHGSSSVPNQISAHNGEDLLFDPPYEHQAEALERTTRYDAAGSGVVVTTGTGSGKTESFLLPVLARLADEASTGKIISHPGSPARCCFIR